MRVLRSLLLVLAALSLVAAVPVAAQTVKLPGGGQVKVTLPAPKGKKGKKHRKGRTRTNTVQVGIADQKADMFSDLRFLSLGIKTARRSIGWDTFQYDWQIADVDDWLQKARAAGVKPVITFARSREHSRIQLIPTRAQWLQGFKQFRQKWPWVRDFVATNESNHNPPAFKYPKLAAQYYKDMKKACPSCRIAAATINERPEKKYMEGWIKKFLKAVGKKRPRYWALHNYYGANVFKTKGTKRFLKATKSGEVWITEVGGLVKRRTGNFAGKLKMPEGLAHSTKSWRFIFDKMLPLSPRIKRVYLYHWNSSGPTDTWDSALIGYDGKPRGGLRLVQQRLKRSKATIKVKTPVKRKGKAKPKGKKKGR